MAQVLKVHQVPPMNGGLPEKNGNGMSLEESSSTSASLSHIPNGLFHTTPTKEMNGASTSIEDDLQLSPSDLRRRSTRASALKAQEKIKLKDDIVQGPQKRINEDDGGDDDGENPDDVGGAGTSSAKKRRLEDGREFDQTCFRFGLRANDDGEVYAMTDESENSSIHDSEMEVIRYHYEKMKNREPDEEQLRERLKMRREAENALRNEEAHLNVLKKMKDSQNRAINKLAAETRQIDMQDAMNAAYKPVLAAAGKMSASGKNLAVSNAQKTMAGLANLTVQQQLELLGKLATQSPAAKQAYALAKKNPSQTTQLFSQLITLNSMQIQKQKEAAAEAAQAAAAQTQAQQAQAAAQQLAQQQAQQAQLAQQKLHNQQTPAQRIQAARLAFRAQADKQLQTIPTQKSQPHDITFLPNPNASAFMALHGLDIVVQHVQKDYSFYSKYGGPAYECEECKTDCAHTWKAIGSSPDDLHLYCENCVRSAQKRKNRLDQTNLLKRAFQKISAQEKEFEKKIAEGQLEQYAEAKAATTNTAATATQSVSASASSSSLRKYDQIPTSSTATVSSTPLGPRLHNVPSSSGTSTPSQAMKTSTPISNSTPKASTSSAKKTMTPQQQQANQMMQIVAQSLKNPIMGQMMSMYMAQQAAQAAQQAQQSRNMPATTNGVSSAAQQQQMAMIFAQVQAMAQVQQAQVQAAQAAQAQQQAKNAAREQQQQQAQAQQQQIMLIATMLAQSQQTGNAMNQQIIQQLQKMTPSQQKAVIEALKNNQKK